MYSTCTFCNKPLGANEVFEEFPVGRRIAFDSAKGRLWVVCRACERWNLSPIEERWEIVELCEREFSGTRIRTSTEQIGLARLPEGLELVRIGSPMRPEFAAWRYGDQFGRRRRIALIKAGVIIGAAGGLAFGLSAIGVGIGSFASLAINGTQRLVNGNPREVVANVPTGNDLIAVKRKRLGEVCLVESGDTWGLVIPEEEGHTTTLEGSEAKYALGLLMPAMNRFAGKKVHVGEAVNLLEASSPENYAFDVARSSRFKVAAKVSAGSVKALDYPVRLALEMATHEEAERRALEGELAILEEAWRGAEEIAAISDDLLIPDSITARLHKPDQP